MTRHSPEFMIAAWDFNQSPATELTEPQQPQAGHWYHLHRAEQGLPQWLAAAGVPEPLAEAMLAEDTRPRFERTHSGFMLILRGVNLTEGSRPEDMVSLRILYHEGVVYSFRKRPIKSISLIRERLSQNDGPNSNQDLLVTIIAEMNNRLEELLDQIEAQMEQLEDDNEGSTAVRQSQLTKLHRSMLRLTRFVRPQVTALERLITDADKWFAEEERQWLQNERDTAHRVLEQLDMLLEQVWMLREHLQQEVAEKMNRNTYWLSMIAGIFLPVSFLTGLFGINIGGMPGVDHADAFWIFCGILAVITVIEFLLLRRLRFW